MSRRPLVPGAKEKLNKLKAEFANENGINLNDESYKGNVTSRDNGHVVGSIGGLMTKKMIEEYEKGLVNKK
ncbi:MULTISPECIES: alpha/beta-type small acid-soluble spore protein [Clostridium]|uniref:Alpha/beta-type small acid-soluble spore protein n=1 Tax=Clostridium cibarium TaxID=2762247 RepID=A0ABR8PR25_9CLOT|nr:MULTISPECIES: alpha/beta-type small acid-soluble spore protein [Clostridium]MBD7910585.1 alpha/beta-type small acid-soluble spore protein [Clostridium cibarium]